MAFKLTHQERERWTEAFKEFRAAQLKLAKKRDEVQAVLAEAQASLRALGARSGPGAELLKAQVQVAELALRQMAVFDPDATVYKQPVEADAPAFELRQLELMLAIVRQDRIAMTSLNALVTTTLAHPADDPAVPPVPAFWGDEQAAIAQDPDRRAGWERFLAAYAVLKAHLDQPVPEGSESPGPPRLAYLRRHAPSARGLQYRVHTVLRQLSCGEALLRAMRQHLLDRLAIDRNASGPEQRAKRGSAATERLRAFFKGSK